jgi:putative ABC transport system permease protein
MLKYNLISSIRHIRRNLSFSLINILGLSLGLTLIIILFLWLQFELSFDKFHEKSERIFRIITEFKPETTHDYFAHVPAPLGDFIKTRIPEVEEYVRFGYLGEQIISYENVQFQEKIVLADPSIFKIFSFRLISGNPETALKQPGSIILSENKAKKYFGNKDPMGKTLLMGEEKSPFIITGVLRNIPSNSQQQFDFLCSFAENKSNLEWGFWNYNTYLLASRKGLYKAITDKLTGIANEIPGDEKVRFHIQPLTWIHLHSDIHSDLSTNTNIKTIYFISSILFLVLIMACINYINMATARYTRRGKEAGLRKVAGATNLTLASQFLFESFTITILAFVIALCLSYLLVPVFNSLTKLPLEFVSLFNFKLISELIFLIILISLIAGSYPAFTLSSVNPIAALRDDFRLSVAVSIKGLRKGLIIFQFLVSIILIAATMIIHTQMAFIRNKNLGINSDQVIIIPTYQAEVKPKIELFKKEILTSPFILNASAAGFTPGTNYYQNAWWEGLQDVNLGYMSWIPADKDFIKTLKIRIVNGEDFPDILSENHLLYILNETAVKKLGWKDPLGKQFEISGIGKGAVIGIVKDFNFRPLYSEIEPVAITYYPEVFYNMMIRISSENIPGSIDFLRNKWKSLFPRSTFEYSFLSDDFQKLYEKENTTLKLITWVSVFSLFISCIGLFGLVLFTIDQKIKEIGLRKVSGSTSLEIVALLNLEFIKWILTAFLLSCPVIIYFMHKWLASFAYRISLSWWMLVVPGMMVLITSLLTVSWHTLYTATRNPAECLRHE